MRRARACRGRRAGARGARARGSRRPARPRALRAAQPRLRPPRRGGAADPSLVNAWGLAFGPTTPAWVADNGTDVSTLYSGGVGASPVAKVPLTVSIPGGAPTGTVFNGSTGFVVHSGTSSGPARFLFSSEAGTITGWNPAVPTAADLDAGADGGHRAGRDLQGARDRRHGDRAADLRERLPQRRGRRVGRELRPGAASRRVPAIRPSRRGYAPFGIQAVTGDDRRHLRQAGRRRGGRGGRARQGLRRRLRHRRDPAAPLRLARPAQRAVGRRAGAAGLRRRERRAADRQLRRRAHQRLRPGRAAASSARCAASTAGRSRSTGCGRSSSATA